MPSHILDALFATIQTRKNADPASSYVAKLFTKGTPKIAQKLGEEAVETVIAAVKGNPQELISESADLLFHWLILLADQGVKPEQVFAELQRREGVSGIAEKQSRTEE